MRRITNEQKEERKAAKRIDVLRKCVGKRAFSKETKDTDTFNGFEFFRLSVTDVMDLVPQDRKFS